MIMINAAKTVSPNPSDVGPTLLVNEVTPKIRNNTPTATTRHPCREVFNRVTLPCRHAWQMPARWHLPWFPDEMMSRQSYPRRAAQWRSGHVKPSPRQSAHSESLLRAARGSEYR